MENSCLDRFQQALGGMAILTILIFLIQEHEISFYFFESSFISFINILYSQHMAFNSLVRFIPKYFGGCDFKRYFFLCSIFDISSLMSRNAVSFCVLISYPATSIDSFINSSSFCVESFLYIVSCHLHIVTIPPLPFQCGYLLVLFLVLLLWLGLPIPC